MKRWLGLCVCLLALPAIGQNAAYNGFCTRGGSPALTSGLPSTNTPQEIIPSCSVKVYLSGTLTPATLFRDSIGTPLSNPFTADATGATAPGKWLFFAAGTGVYDVVMSGGIAPNVFPSPVTLTGLQNGSGGGGGGGGFTIPLSSQFCALVVGVCSPNTGIASMLLIKTYGWADPPSSGDTSVTPNNFASTLPSGSQLVRMGNDGYAGNYFNNAPVVQTQANMFPNWSSNLNYSNSLGHGGVGPLAGLFQSVSSGPGFNTIYGNDIPTFQSSGWTGTNNLNVLTDAWKMGLNSGIILNMNMRAIGDANVFRETVNMVPGASTGASEGISDIAVNQVEFGIWEGTITGTTGSGFNVQPTLNAVTQVNGSATFSAGGFVMDTTAANVAGTLTARAGLMTTTGLTTVTDGVTVGSGQTPGFYIVTDIGGAGGTGALMGISVQLDGTCGFHQMLAPGKGYTGQATFHPGAGGTPCDPRGLPLAYLNSMQVSGGLTASTSIGIASGTWGAITGYSISGNVLTLNVINAYEPGQGQSFSLSGFGTSTFLNGVLFTPNAATGTTLTGPFTHANAGPVTESGQFICYLCQVSASTVDGTPQSQNVVGWVENGTPFVSGQMAWLASEATPEKVVITFAGSVAGTGQQNLTILSQQPHATFSALFQGGTNGCLYFDQNAKTVANGGINQPSCYNAYGAIDSTHLIYGYLVTSAQAANLLPNLGAEPESFAGGKNGFHVYQGAQINYMQQVANANPLLPPTYTPVMVQNDVAWSAGHSFTAPSNPASEFHGASLFVGGNTPCAPGGCYGEYINPFGAAITNTYDGELFRNGNPASMYTQSGGWASLPRMITAVGPWDSILHLLTVPNQAIIDMEGDNGTTPFSIYVDCPGCAGTITDDPVLGRYQFSKDLRVDGNISVGQTITSTGSFSSGGTVSGRTLTANFGDATHQIALEAIGNTVALAGFPQYLNFEYATPFGNFTHASSAILGAGKMVAGTLYAGATPSVVGNVSTTAPGATLYTYTIYSSNANGFSAATGTINVNAVATLTGPNHNSISAGDDAPGATGYILCRTSSTGGLSPGVIVVNPDPRVPMLDTGQAPSGSCPSPTGGTSGSLTVDGPATFNGAGLGLQIIPIAFTNSPATCNSGLAGTILTISDATTQTWGATVTGGGALYAVITCDGTNWTVMGK